MSLKVYHYLCLYAFICACHMCGHSEPEEVVKCLGAVVRRVVACSKVVTNLRSLEKTLKTLNISLATEKSL